MGRGLRTGAESGHPDRRELRRDAGRRRSGATAGAPPVVKRVIAAADEIDGTPYIWGGGHASFPAKGYDCSGAVSYALHGAGLLDYTQVSGQLAHYGEPGPGRWITIYANAEHVFMVVAGLRFDTRNDPEGRQRPALEDGRAGSEHPAEVRGAASGRALAGSSTQGQGVEVLGRAADLAGRFQSQQAVLVELSHVVADVADALVLLAEDGGHLDGGDRELEPLHRGKDLDLGRVDREGEESIPVGEGRGWRGRIEDRPRGRGLGPSPTAPLLDVHLLPARNYSVHRASLAWFASIVGGDFRNLADARQLSGTQARVRGGINCSPLTVPRHIGHCGRSWYVSDGMQQGSASQGRSPGQVE